MSTQPTNDLATVKRSAKSLTPPSKRDRIRWHLFNQRKSYEEIAGIHKCSLGTVQASIDRVEAFRNLTSASEISLELNSVVLEHVGALSQSLAESLLAERVTRRINAEGNEVEERSPDHKNRHEARLDLMKIADRNLPKGGGVHVAVQQNANTSLGPEKHISFEELLRQRREAKGLTNGDAVQDAEYVDVDESEEEDEDGDEE